VWRKAAGRDEERHRVRSASSKLDPIHHARWQIELYRFGASVFGVVAADVDPPPRFAFPLSPPGHIQPADQLMRGI
jgi:hypothetical protein